MKNKFTSLILDVKDLTKKVLERNILIIILSTIVFAFFFFTENGIIHQYYLYNLKKHTLEMDITKKKQELAILHRKIEGLEQNNPDVMEEVQYLYQNKDPYPERKKTIISIDVITKEKSTCKK